MEHIIIDVFRTQWNNKDEGLVLLGPKYAKVYYLFENDSYNPIKNVRAFL